MGVSATIWAYTDGVSPETDHEAMTEPRDGWFLAVRASGVDLTEFESLLAQVVRTDEAGFAAGTASHDVLLVDDATIAEMLTQVPAPTGLDHLSKPFQGLVSRFHVLYAVASDVGCAWVDEYAAGRGDDALAALVEPASWPLFAGREDADELAAVPRRMGQQLEHGSTPRWSARRTAAEAAARYADVPTASPDRPPAPCGDQADCPRADHRLVGGMSWESSAVYNATSTSGCSSVWRPVECPEVARGHAPRERQPRLRPTVPVSTKSAQSQPYRGAFLTVAERLLEGILVAALRMLHIGAVDLDVADFSSLAHASGRPRLCDRLPVRVSGKSAQSGLAAALLGLWTRLVQARIGIPSDQEELRDVRPKASVSSPSS